eukprot:CAMPEP_0197648230 /NCGR_PEP_ID=MMETSP1338-20131121/27633_1 /TAXON_ID=43686 ORGANISM="Pelagodinium beii, Strain RCC1491" /NCGR_SAMPLE_ID=MMETSP1338 /ASSEMBLY_ACC=CAM_ASM_000754 /LENGTH=127 /DNA_ID=CAMNT_0043222195 /DNA_START=84 /DNA_END=467 /DNA_ORIENTATION=+
MAFVGQAEKLPEALIPAGFELVNKAVEWSGDFDLQKSSAGNRTLSFVLPNKDFGITAATEYHAVQLDLLFHRRRLAGHQDAAELPKLSESSTYEWQAQPHQKRRQLKPVFFLLPEHAGARNLVISCL